jgi:alpha-tubulin suppressor-like RCC1 family protein
MCGGPVLWWYNRQQHPGHPALCGREDYSFFHRFTALLQDGTVFSWGDNDMMAAFTAVCEQLVNIIKVPAKLFVRGDMEQRQCVRLG